MGGGAKGLDSAPWSLFHAADFAPCLMDAFQAGSFTLNPAVGDDELTDTYPDGRSTTGTLSRLRRLVAPRLHGDAHQKNKPDRLTGLRLEDPPVIVNRTICSSQNPACQFRVALS